MANGTTPLRIAAIVFAILFFSGVLIGFVVSIVAVRPCYPTSPLDPCDGGSVAAGFIWTLSIAVSLLVATAGAAMSALIVRARKKQTRKGV